MIVIATNQCAVFRPTYGPIKLNASESGNIVFDFNLGYPNSFVECLLNGDIQNPTQGGEFSTWTSGAYVTIAGGTQNLVEFIVTNQESAVSTTYDVTIIRPLTICSDAELSPW